MAGCNYSVDDDFMEQLERMENADEIVPPMLEACAPIIIDAEKKELQAHKRTGSLINSIKSTGVKKNEWGHYIVVRPTGKNSAGVRNMESFIYNEYGTSTQQADPIQKKIISITSDEIEKKMQETFESEVGL